VLAKAAGSSAACGSSEIIVEYEMLKGVVQRYAPNVMMTKLDKINIGKLPESRAADNACF
jgi:hypothetical protein